MAKEKSSIEEEDPVGESYRELLMWIGGGAMPNSSKWEEARAKLDVKLAFENRRLTAATLDLTRSNVRWQKILGILTGVVVVLTGVLVYLTWALLRVPVLQ